MARRFLMRPLPRPQELLKTAHARRAGHSRCSPHGGDALVKNPTRHFMRSGWSSAPALLAVHVYSPGGTCV